jgi:hypothetical protein
MGSEVSRARRIAFALWIAASSATLGIGFFGLTSLVIAWFGEDQGVANPVTDLGYGALVGILITGGLLVQLRACHTVSNASPRRSYSSVRLDCWSG